jgi:hypothetical protein
MTIVPFLRDNVFGPQDIQAMSTALEDVCNILNLADQARGERELVARKIVVFAHRGQRDAALLRIAEGRSFRVEASGLRRSSAPRNAVRFDVGTG